MEKFRGNFKYSIDNKGRFMLPNEIKKIVISNKIEEFIILPGFSQTYKYLFVLPYYFAKRIEDKLESLKFFDTKAQKIYTYFFGNSFKLSLDGQGRLRIPQKVIDNMAIGNDIIVTGEGDFMKIWLPNDYDEMIKKEMSFNDNALNDLLKYVNEKYDI
ncbi:hypothetical protein J7L48_02135 [bacterium]|nr:hypothetical protein [bacterium]